MSLNNKIYDISLNNDDSPQTELVEVNLNSVNGKKNNYSNLLNDEIKSSIESKENYDNDEDFYKLKEQFNSSEIIDKNLELKNQKSIKYRKGNLYIIYNKKRKAIIVIGPDCKFLFFEFSFFIFN